MERRTLEIVANHARITPYNDGHVLVSLRVEDIYLDDLVEDLVSGIGLEYIADYLRENGYTVEEEEPKPDRPCPAQASKG